MDKQDDRVKFLAKLPADLHHRLKVAAARHSVNMNDLVCDGIKMWLDEIDHLDPVDLELRPATPQPYCDPRIGLESQQ